MKLNNLSFWSQSLSDDVLATRAALMATVPPLSAQSHFDVVIVGGGFSGLWLAYYLKQAQPHLSVAIFEAKQVGYGASGRNGGWLSTNLPSSITNLLKHGHITQAQICAFQRQVIDTIDEVDGVCQREGIDCDLHKGGLLFVATNEAQAVHLQQYYEKERTYGFSDDELVPLSSQEGQAIIRIPSMVAAVRYRDGARIQPAKLVMGLQRVLLQQGVAIYENTPVLSMGEGNVLLAQGVVKGDNVICCTEGYTDQLLHNRKVIPVNSSIIITKPLPDDFWARFGWGNAELLGDLAHVYIYAQRTRDNRILFGGRGAPYQYQSRDAGDGHLDDGVATQLYRRLTELFPGYPFEIECAWKGSLGVTRDWNPTVTFDDQRRQGWIYGFAGNGVGPTNLAARTMVDKILGHQTERTALPWSDFANPTWEREPWRWLGIHSMYKMLGWADAVEARFKLKKPVFFADWAYKICGMD